MSRPFSNTLILPDEMTRRLATAGMECRFDRAFPPIPSPPTADGSLFAFPVPENNSTLTVAGLKRAFGSDPRRQPCVFDHPWYANELFMDEPCEPGWHFLGMDVHPESVHRSWDACAAFAPSAVEVVLMLFLHYLGGGGQLLAKKHTWCRDAASLGRRVTVGAFGRNGVFVSAHPPQFSSRGLGVIGRELPSF